MPISRIRRSSAAVLAGLTVTTLGAGVLQAEVASAATKATVTSSIGLDGNKSHLIGKVSSKKAQCKKTTVVLHWLEPGEKKYRVVAEDDTTAKGAWSIYSGAKKIPAGKYFVTTAATGACKAVKSRVFTV